jgi:hypothetical protein
LPLLIGGKGEGKMRKKKKSILVLAIISFFTVTMVFFWGVSAVGEKYYIPAVPDKNKTLPANDGGPDGCNSSRFECVMGGEAVLDKQTGLTWARNADIAAGKKPWQEAIEFCQDLVIGNRKGWRLPTKEELISLLDTSRGAPALPDGHPFKNVKLYGDYWSSTTYEGNSSSVWAVGLHYGRVTDNLKIFDSRIWPVLGGN